MEEKLSFKYSEARVLPVILMLDTSGSMYSDGKISALNEAVTEMLQSFAENSDNNVEINVAVVKFGSSAEIVYPLQPAAELVEKYVSLNADGSTPLGAALTKTKEEIIERKDIITSRTYRPMVVLVSDGMPNDEWMQPLEKFVNEGRSAKCSRIAMGIGAPKGSPAYDVLCRFTGDSELVVSADQANQIKSFFRYVTISTIARTKSSNPNSVDLSAIYGADLDDSDDDDLF